MSQIKILIADPNEVYLDGIALEFLKREPDRVDLHGITENDYWEEFCGASEEYDIALINERMAGEEIPAERFRYIFILTETMDGTDLSVFSKKDIKTILKWVSASEIYDQVVNGCPFYEILAEREREEADRLRREEEQRAREKAERIRAAAVKSPGPLPVFLEVFMPDGAQVEVDLGPAARVGVTVSFLSELSKVVPQSDTAFAPNDKVYLDPPERKPWES